jgi:lipoprotein-anchoring transpeptidase ErfK/SrfK
MFSTAHCGIERGGGVTAAAARARTRLDGKGPIRFVAAALLAAAALALPGCRSVSGSAGPHGPAIEVPEGPELAAAIRKLEKDLAQEEARGKKLLAKVSRFSPTGTYIVVDTGMNHLYLMNGEKIVRDALCSTGSGSRLVDVAGKRVWVFNTPRGEFEVLRKIVNPVWTKPDWAFIEDGEPIPKNFADRLDPDVLGAYALQLPDGYLIHGSIYKRTIGMSVTHGCIRVGDQDLEAFFKAAQVGTKVYII